jgi:hypothetical protein
MVEQNPAADDDSVGPSIEQDEEFEEQHERVESLTGNAGVLKSAWKDTLEDMEALADEHRAEGYDVTVVPSVDAGPIGRDTNNPDGEYGVEFVIADNYVEEFTSAFEAGEYSTYDVYRAEVENEAFLVVELVDEEAEQVILLAGAFSLRDTMMAAFAARQEGETYTFVRTMDGERHGTFKHEGYRKFFPRAEDLPEDPKDLPHL